MQAQPTSKVSEEELELARAASLISDIVDGRLEGSRDSLHGTDDDDLLAAVEELEGAIGSWREATR